MRDPSSDIVKQAAVPLVPERINGIVADLIGGADIVLMGTATHGTHEFYRLRADLTRTLIESHGFNVVAVEADWPDAYRVNRWVRQGDEDQSAEEALDGFTRFPRWSWRNKDVVRFLDWLRAYNAERPPHARAGFYGLDLYNMHRSIDGLLRYLTGVNRSAVDQLRRRYGCFDVFGDDAQAYGYAGPLGLTRASEHEAIAQLAEQRRKATQFRPGDPHSAEDHFAAEQNERVTQEAEAYYHELIDGSATSWNLRDAHMFSTLEAVLGHALRMAGQARAVVWAHNAHLGDARATRMGARGETNLAQLARARFGERVCLLGFTTHTGSVTVAHSWAGPVQVMAVRPSRRDSYEHLFHEVGLPCFALDLHGAAEPALSTTRLERAIGAVYRPESERWTHYFEACLPRQFDIVVHVDETQAVEPLEPWSRQEVDVPEMWPASA